MTLKIERAGDVVIYAPFKTPHREVENFFRENLPWIQKKISENKTRWKEEKRFVEGEEFYYLGKLYPLYYSNKYWNGDGLRLEEDRFLLDENNRGSIRQAFIQWYKRMAENILLKRVSYYSELMGLFPFSLKITNALKRYGSCSHKNSLCFSWRLVLAPPSIIDYVVVHELSHIKEKNHSKNFWRLVSKFIPDYKSKRVWLRKNRHIFDL